MGDRKAATPAPSRPKSDVIELGDEVKDVVTSFQGVVVAITKWLNGCRRMVVQPRQLGEKGQMPITESIDEKQLVIVAKAVVPTEHAENAGESETRSTKGGPRPAEESWPAATRR